MTLDVDAFNATITSSVLRGLTVVNLTLHPATSGSVPAYRYVLRGDGPPPALAEVEHSARLAIEVVILWGGDILTVSHTAPPGSFFVGGLNSAADISLPDELLGCGRLCIAVSSLSELYAVLPAHARGWCTLPDGSTYPFPPASESEQLLSLDLGCRAHLSLGDIEIQVAAVLAGRAPPARRSLGFDSTTLAYFGLTSLWMAGALGMLSLMAPPLGLTEDEQTVKERLYLLQTYLGAATRRLETDELDRRVSNVSVLSAAARRRDPIPRVEPMPGEDEHAQSPATDALLGGDGTAAVSPDRRERRKQIDEARRFGAIGLMTDIFEALNDPKLHFRRELSGAELTEMQRLFNSDMDPLIAGPGQLALSGTGLGGGDQAAVIPLRAVSTFSSGEGQRLERASHSGSPTGNHRPQAIQVRASIGEAPDALAPAIVRRTVDAQFWRIRTCYEQGLAEDSSLAGTAEVRFAVSPDGQVDHVSIADSNLPLVVRTCIAGVFHGLKFPSSGSELNGAYPLRFAP